MSLLSCICGAGASPGQHPNPTFFAPSLTFLACGSLLVHITGQSSLAPAWPHLPGPEILDTSCVCHMRPGSARDLPRRLYAQSPTAPPTCAPSQRIQRVWVPKSEARSPRGHQLPHTCLGIGSTSPDPSSNVFFWMIPDLYSLEFELGLGIFFPLGSLPVQGEPV